MANKLFLLSALFATLLIVLPFVCQAGDDCTCAPGASCSHAHHAAPSGRSNAVFEQIKAMAAKRQANEQVAVGN